jgi:hypothetical protein
LFAAQEIDNSVRNINRNSSNDSNVDANFDSKLAEKLETLTKRAALTIHKTKELVATPAAGTHPPGRRHFKSIQSKNNSKRAFPLSNSLLKQRNKGFFFVSHEAFFFFIALFNL